MEDGYWTPQYGYFPIIADGDSDYLQRIHLVRSFYRYSAVVQAVCAEFVVYLTFSRIGNRISVWLKARDLQLKHWQAAECTKKANENFAFYVGHIIFAVPEKHMLRIEDRN